MKQLILTAIAALSYLASIGQVTQATNAPNGNNFVGFNNTSGIALPIENQGFDEINISSNFRTKMAITELPTWNGLNGLSRTNVQRTTMGLQGEVFPAWSLLHLWSENNPLIPIPLSLRRSWMNVGTSYTANVDFMYVGA